MQRWSFQPRVSTFFILSWIWVEWGGTSPDSLYVPWCQADLGFLGNHELPGKKNKKTWGDKSYYLSSVFVLHIGGKNQQRTWGPGGPRSPGRPGLPDSPWEQESWGDGDEMIAQDIPQSKLIDIYIYVGRWTDMISIQCTYILAVLSRGAGRSTGTHGTLKWKSNIRWEC